MDPERSARGAGHPQKASFSEITVDVDFMSNMTLGYHGLSWIIMDYEQHL